ncbi:MAG: DUF1080 domain-containing protein [Chitinophagaceae bacterium]
MKTTLFTYLLFPTCYFLVTTSILHAQDDPAAPTRVWNPVPKTVKPGKTAADAPSDAIVLFDGKSLANWKKENGSASTWKLDNNAMTAVKDAGDIHTKKGFGDCQLHIEWRTPAEVKGEGQGRGNSGIFFMGRYELQVLDSYKNSTYVNGQAGSMYKQYIPLVNACRPPGEWQSFDVIFTAPQFNADSSLKTPARITVMQNGVLIQNNVVLWGNTVNEGIPQYIPHAAKLPLVLQDHGDPVSYRNIWIREL